MARLSLIQSLNFHIHFTHIVDSIYRKKLQGHDQVPFLLKVHSYWIEILNEINLKEIQYVGYRYVH